MTSIEAINERLAVLEQRDKERDREIRRLRSVVDGLIPSQDEQVRAMADAIKKGDKKRIKELNRLNAIRMKKGD